MYICAMFIFERIFFIRSRYYLYTVCAVDTNAFIIEIRQPASKLYMFRYTHNITVKYIELFVPFHGWYLIQLWYKRSQRHVCIQRVDLRASIVVIYSIFRLIYTNGKDVYLQKTVITLEGISYIIICLSYVTVLKSVVMSQRMMFWFFFSTSVFQCFDVRSIV